MSARQTPQTARQAARQTAQVQAQAAQDRAAAEAHAARRFATAAEPGAFFPPPLRAVEVKALDGLVRGRTPIGRGDWAALWALVAKGLALSPEFCMPYVSRTGVIYHQMMQIAGWVPAFEFPAA